MTTSSRSFMNTRRKHPNSAQLLKNSLNWSIGPYVGVYGGKNVGPPLQAC